MLSTNGRKSLLLAVAAVLLTAVPAVPQSQPRKAPATIPAPREAPKASPRLEAVAETKLLMEGLNQANFRGMERLLKQKPADAETWAFLRGQALLIAEAGNLLLLRPPRNSGEAAWMERSTELRERGAALARFAAARDYEATRAAFDNLADSCNRCHQSFRVPVRIVPFADAPERKVSPP